MATGVPPRLMEHPRWRKVLTHVTHPMPQRDYLRRVMLATAEEERDRVLKDILAGGHPLALLFDGTPTNLEVWHWLLESFELATCYGLLITPLLRPGTCYPHSPAADWCGPGQHHTSRSEA